MDGACSYGAVLVTKGGHIFLAHNLRSENGGAVVPAERTAVIKAVCEGYTDFKVSSSSRQLFPFLSLCFDMLFDIFCTCPTPM